MGSFRPLTISSRKIGSMSSRLSDSSVHGKPSELARSRRVISAERRYCSWRNGGDASPLKYRSLIVSTNWAATSSGSAPSSSIGLNARG